MNPKMRRMYGIFTCMYHTFRLNVGKYIIHGAYAGPQYNDPNINMIGHCKYANCVFSLVNGR